MPEGWDWVKVQHEACPQCGLDPSTVAPAGLAGAVREEAARWEALLAHGDDTALRAHPEPGTWSALEYGCHCRDLLAVMTERVARTLAEDGPEYGWWDHEAAVADEHYNEQDPVAVAGDLAANAEWLAGTLGLVEGGEWDRTGTRRGSEPFTVAGLARFTLHELFHHRGDAERLLAG